MAIGVRSWSVVVGTAGAIALLIGACGGGSGGEEPPGDDAAADAGIDTF